MRILRATSLSQGDRDNDFSWTNEGEIVRFPASECTREEVDGHCGCRRAMCGVESQKSTTTFIVAEDPRLTHDHLVEILANSLRQGGWFTGQEDAALDFAREEAEELEHIATNFNIGSILERRGNEIRRRR